MPGSGSLVELIYCLAVAGVAIGFGNRLFRYLNPNCQSVAEEVSFSLGLGMGAFALGVMVLGLAHLLYEATLYLLILGYGYAGRKELIGIAARLRGRGRDLPIGRKSFYSILLLLVGLGLLLTLARALTPVHGAVDPLAYHLALPKIFLNNHALTFEPTLTGALYPSNVGMLFTLGIGLRGAVLAQVFHFFLGVSTLFFIAAFCRSYFDDRVGVWALIFFSFTPVLVFYAPLGYVDVGVCFFQFLAVWALFNALRDQTFRAVALAAVLSGLAIGSKHTALPTAALALVSLAAAGLWRRQSTASVVRQCTFFAVIVLVLASPWYIRSFVESGNPVWPLGNAFFEGTPYRGTFSTGSEAKVGQVATSIVPSYERLTKVLYQCATALWSWSWDTMPDDWGSASPDWQRAIGIYHIVFLPGLLIYARQKRVALLTGFCLVYYLIVVLRIDGNPRYSIFLFAYLSVLSGFVAERMVQGRLRRLRFVLVLAVALTAVGNLSLNYLVASRSVGHLMSETSNERFLIQSEENYRVFRQVNAQLPDTAKVLLQGIVKGYYCDRDYLWDHPHQMVINYREYNTQVALIERMRELGISHVVRRIEIPGIRLQLGYPQYFTDPFHEAFRKKHLKLIYRDEKYVLFEVVFPAHVGAYRVGGDDA